MDIIKHYGSTIERDLVLSFSRHGMYFAIGRLDGGFDSLLCNWMWGRRGSMLYVGPFNFMWSRKVSE